MRIVMDTYKIEIKIFTSKFGVGSGSFMYRVTDTKACFCACAMAAVPPTTPAVPDVT